MRILTAALALVVLGGCAGAPIAPGAMGTVTGTVVIAPCRPVERVGDPPCPPRPGIKVHFDQAASSPTAVTDGAGVYSIRLPAGDYRVWAEGGIARGPSTRVSVVAGQVVTLNLNVDSGIR